MATKITRDDLPSQWQEEAIGLYEQGAGDVEILAMLDISRGTFQRLCREDNVFLAAIKRGRRLCEAWWQLQGRTGIHDKEFNSVLWMMNMSNRYKWMRNPDLKNAPADNQKAEKTARETAKLLTSFTSDGYELARPDAKGK